MSDLPSNEAWNNFVMCSQPSDYEPGSSKRSAAIAKVYMGQANRGGINSFLTNNNELDAAEVLEALVSVDASVAAEQFNLILRGLGVPVPSASEEARWNLLDRYWTDALNEHDILSEKSDSDLMRALEAHVRQHEAFYLTLAQSE
jgi:hypothetical protein